MREYGFNAAETGGDDWQFDAGKKLFHLLLFAKLKRKNGSCPASLGEMQLSTCEIIQPRIPYPADRRMCAKAAVLRYAAGSSP